MRIQSLTTEGINPNTINIDQMQTEEMLAAINNEDRNVTKAIEESLPEIVEVVDVVVESIKNGGHIFFVGAGTSGRLGVLEAAECPPTFGVSPELFQGVIAGGEGAIFKSVEQAEDDEAHGRSDLEKRSLQKEDIVIGIAASGRTPYVIGALNYAREVGAKSVSLACNKQSLIGTRSDLKIEVVPGPEVITGSTRMKAGTAQKLVLNMITTSSMIKVGKVFQNQMVDLNVSNQKLKERALNMLMNLTGTDEVTAQQALESSNYNVKTAIVMVEKAMNFESAIKLLEQTNGSVREAIQQKNTQSMSE